MCKYINMFKSSEQFFSKENLKTQVSWAKSTLKKEDKIIWYLRIYRFTTLRSQSDSAYILSEKQAGKFKSVESALDYTSLVNVKDPIAALNDSLKHYMDLDLAVINDFVFGDKSISDVLSALQTYENKWLEKIELLSRELPLSGKEILTVGKYTWFNLECSGSRSEGESMRHCGNGAGMTSQVVFSLRSKGLTLGHWIPQVTLILNGCDTLYSPGYTTEIKGRFNQKPSEEYHEAIIALMASDLILGMRDGGHLSQNNFKISDLSDELRLKLKINKPSLFPVAELIADGKGVVTDAMRIALVAQHDDESQRMDVLSDSFESFSSDYDLTTFIAYRNLLSGDYDDFCEDDKIALQQNVSLHFQQVFADCASSTLVKVDFDRQKIIVSLSYEDFLIEAVNINTDEWSSFEILRFDLIFNEVCKVVLKRIDIDDIAATHNHLLNMTDSFVLSKGKITNRIYQEALKEFSQVETVGEYGPCQPFVEIFKGDLEELAEHMGMKTLASYVGTINEGRFDDFGQEYYDFGNIESSVEKVVSKLSDDERLNLSINLSGALDMDLKEVNSLSSMKIAGLIGEYSKLDDNLEHELKNSLWFAEEAGAFNQLYSAAESAINQIAAELGATVDQDCFYSISLKMSLQNYLSFLAKHIEEQVGLADFNYEADAFDASIDALCEETSEYVETDLEGPQYGFQGFCESTAEDTISEALTSLVAPLAVAA
jgi:hypothetical protein